MRIGMDARILHGRLGGVTTYIRCLADAFVALGHEVLMISNHPLPEYDTNPRTLVCRKRLGPLKFRRLWEKALLPLTARRMGIDVLQFACDPVPPGLKTCPHVAIIHDLYAFSMPDLYDPKQGERLRWQFAESGRKSDAVITGSETSKSDIIRFLGVPTDKITVIPLAPRADVGRINDAEMLEETKRRMGLPERFVLCVGGKNNKFHKNTHCVVEAMALLTDGTAGDLGLVFVGRESEYLAGARQIAEKTGVACRAQFAGLVDPQTLCHLYNLATVFAFPSLYEGFGLPILEAMTCGTPVITTNYGAMKEVAGNAAILIDPNDPASIADAISRLATDPQCHREYSDRGLARSSLFTWRNTAEMTLEVFRQVCGR